MMNETSNKPGTQKPTQIPGQADWDPCLKKAAMLILDIYEYEDDVLTLNEKITRPILNGSANPRRIRL